MKATHKQSLEDRIKRVRAEINAVVDARVEAVAKESPGVPAGVIRNLLVARAPSCPCTQYLDLVEQEAGYAADERLVESEQ